jgi:hypothetical protein
MRSLAAICRRRSPRRLADVDIDRHSEVDRCANQNLQRIITINALPQPRNGRSLNAGYRFALTHGEPLEGLEDCGDQQALETLKFALGVGGYQF